MMFTALLEKLHAARGPDGRRGRRRRWTRSWTAARRAGADRGLAHGPRDEGRAAGRDRRPRADDARARGAAVEAATTDVFDTCGTGGDRSGTFNISSVAALVVAACGVPRRQARQPLGVEPLRQRRRVRGARRAASRRRRRSVERCSTRRASAFLFAPTFHPSMRHAAPARRELGVRTAFNLLGPLTNPAGAARQLVGVPRPELTELVARALLLLGSRARLGRARRRRPRRDLDDRATRRCRSAATARCNTFYVHPADFGLPKAPRRGAARAATPARNAAIARACWPASRAPRATSCCSTPARRCSSPGAAPTVARRDRRGRRGHRSRAAPRRTLDAHGRACRTEAAPA